VLVRLPAMSSPLVDLRWPHRSETTCLRFSASEAYLVAGNQTTMRDQPLSSMLLCKSANSWLCVCTNILTSFANVLTLIITLLYISTGSFRALLTFVGMAEWVFYVSTVIGLLILRRREPQLERPYRPAIFLPVAFVVIGTLVILRSAMFAPTQSGLLAGLLIVGALVSRLRSRLEDDST
jgi:hypothetical protein